MSQEQQFETKWILMDGHQMEHAFDSGGESFFCFVNDFKIPIERAHAAREIYDSLEWRVDKLYLESMIQAIRVSCNKGNLQQVFEEVAMLEERMKAVHNIDMVYKLASVYYIAKNENAYSYDFAFNEQKIKHWIENKTFDAFFLSVHMKDLLPSFEAYSNSFQTYFKGQTLEEVAHLKNHLSIIQSGSIENGLNSRLTTRIQELQELVAKI